MGSVGAKAGQVSYVHTDNAKYCYHGTVRGCLGRKNWNQLKFSECQSNALTIEPQEL